MADLMDQIQIIPSCAHEKFGKLICGVCAKVKDEGSSARDLDFVRAAAKFRFFFA
jgi:hypothetical protein